MSDAQIFQAFSVLYISVGIGMLVNPDFYKKMLEDFFENAAVTYLGAIMALVVGFLIVTFHNTWTKDFSVIITVLGWMALTKGVLMLLKPELIIALTKAIFKKEKSMKIEAVVVTLLGLALSFLGFCPKSPI